MFAELVEFPESPDANFVSIEEAIEELRAGRMIVVADDDDRENEDDLTMAAEMVTADVIDSWRITGEV